MKDLQSLWDSASGSLDVRVSHTVELPAASEYPELSVQAFLNNNAGVYFYQGQTSFTPEQLETLKGPKGEQGEKGDPGAVPTFSINEEGHLIAAYEE